MHALSNWRVWLMLTHRWMGIIIGLMFVAWVASGIVLLYFGLPHLTAGERWSRRPPLDVAAIAISPADAVKRVDGDPFRMRVSMQRQPSEPSCVADSVRRVSRLARSRGRGHRRVLLVPQPLERIGLLLIGVYAVTGFAGFFTTRVRRRRPTRQRSMSRSGWRP